MSARDNILARIRASQGRSGATTPDELAAVRAAIAQHRSGPLPAMSWTDGAARFAEQCQRLQTTTDRIANVEEAPAAVARYLRDAALPARIAGWNEFAHLGWREAGIEFADRPADKDDPIGLTGAFCAIAETGTLLILGARATPKVTALLPETHIAIVRSERIVRTMEDAFALVRRETGELPRATFFVSGPSRTADIEQTIVIGAHGPYRVHVIVV